MKQAIHHVELNEKLELCFKKLDEITMKYRKYDGDYQEIVNKYPSILDMFYEEFEKECALNFKLFNEDQRDRIHWLFERETADR